MSNLPIGWGDRHNPMSEKDMALGGAAATKFANKGGGGAYQDGDVSYKTSQDVREHYLKLMETKDASTTTTTAQGYSSSSTADSSLPMGWGQREKDRETFAKQQGVFAAKSSPPSVAATNGTEVAVSSAQAEVALLQVATHSLEALAMVLENSTTGTQMPTGERAKFASAVKRAMDALAKSR